MEKNPEMCALIRRNLESLSLTGRSEVLNMEVSLALPFLYKKGARYDIIFMDPPYDKGYVSETTALLRSKEVYGPNTLFIVEHSKRERCAGPETDEGGGASTRHYGNTCLTICESHCNITKRSP